MHNMIKNPRIKYITAVRMLRRNCSVTVKGTRCGHLAFIETHNQLNLATTNFQKTLLGAGSALVSLANPWRGDMIAAMSETTGLDAVEIVRNKMLLSREGQRILTDKPRINSSTVDVNKLENLDKGTVGNSYFKFLKRYNYTPDARLAVRFVDDIELAYVVQRYREIHDLIHTILNMPTNMLGEVTVKWVEGIQTRFPMCVGGAIFGAARLAPKLSRHYCTQQRPDLQITHPVAQYKRHPGIVNTRRVDIPAPIKSTIDMILKERHIPDVYEQGMRLQRYLQCRKPPTEEADLRKAKLEFTAKISDKYLNKAEDNEEDREYRRKKILEEVQKLMLSRIYNWKPMVYDDVTSHYYLCSRAAPEYAAIYRVLFEIKKRDVSFIPKFIFNYRSGVGVATWAAHELWGEHIKENFNVDPSADMNNLARLILQGNKCDADPFVTGLFQRQFLPVSSRQYDLVICAYSLFELQSQQARIELIANLWAKTDKYLVIVENGTKAGFNLVEQVREIVLQLAAQKKHNCHIFAPCPHDLACPRIIATDKTPCNFLVKYGLLKNLNETQREGFCYLVLKKGHRSQNVQWPRIVREVLPRHRHIICRLCTPAGKLDEVVVTKKRSGVDLYKCAKYSSWGDLLPVSNPSGSTPSNDHNNATD